MDTLRKIDLIKEFAEEIVTEEELKEVFETNSRPIAYDGFEPSGVAPIHFGLLRATNLKNMLKAIRSFIKKKDVKDKAINMKKSLVIMLTIILHIFLKYLDIVKKYFYGEQTIIRNLYLKVEVGLFGTKEAMMRQKKNIYHR